MTLLSIVLIIIIHSIAIRVVYPFILIKTQLCFGENSNEKVMLHHTESRKDKENMINRQILKWYLSFYEAMYTIMMMINNYSFAVLNVLTLHFYLHFASKMKTNGVFKNILLIAFPLDRKSVV